MKRILSLVLILCLLLPAAGALAEEAPRKVTIGLALNTNVEDYDTNAYTLYLEEKMNLDVELFLMEDMTQKLPVLIASNSELPDIICGTLDNTTTWNFVQQGAFVPLTEYWNNSEMTRNFDAEVAKLDDPEKSRAAILSAITMPDGEIYTLPKYDEVFWTLSTYRAFINQDWLNKLGLAMPTTTEELKNVLTRFVQDDPNGNGKQDELGLVTMANGYGSNPLVWQMNAFIHANPDVNYFNLEDGKVVPAFTQEAFKEGLRFSKELYDAGLIAPESFTQDQTQLRALINGEEAICGMVVAASESNFSAEGRLAEYTILNAVEGPQGVRYVASNPPNVVGICYVTRDAEDPALCFEILESHYDFTMRRNFRNGPEGEYWSIDPEVTALYKGNFEVEVGVEPTLAIVKNVWNKPNNVIWNVECMPFFNTNEFTMSQAMTLETEENKGIPTNSELNYLRNHTFVPDELLGSLVHTAEETETLAMIQPVIIDYVKENMTAFVTGERDLADWDSYVEELYSMDLQVYIDTLQTAYDRAY